MPQPVVLTMLAALALQEAGAQSVKSVLESLTGAPQAAVAEPPAQEQLEWARARAEEAKREEASLTDLPERLKQADLPASRVEDFRSALREIRRGYEGAADVISAILSIPDKPQGPPVFATPASEEQAAVLREDLRRSLLLANAAGTEIDLLKRMVSQQQALSANADREARQSAEEVATSKSAEARSRASLQQELAGLQRRAADAGAFFCKWKLYQQERTRDRALADQEAIRAALKAAGLDGQLNPVRASKQIAATEKELSALEKELSAAARDQQRAVQEASALKEDSPLSAAAAGLVSAAQGLNTALQGTRSLLELEKAHWVTVQGLSRDMDTAGIQAAVRQAEENIRSARDWRPTMDRRLIEARESLEAAQKQLRTGSPDAALRGILDRTVSVGQKRVDAIGNLVLRSEGFIDLQEEFLSELREALGRESPSQRAIRLWERLASAAAAFWAFPLFPAGESNITAGKILMGALGLVLALVVSGWISRMTTRAASRKFRLADDQRTLLDRSIFIPVAAVLILTVLNWLSIPLTVFAFLGGALAIGLGFGVQNLMNNFISGIILLLERQIKVGDIIEVAGSTGKVTHLGSRCSRIRKFDGVELLVPNSAFLEKEVTNWTLADPQHRFDFTIGVAYGSPVARTMDLLAAALDRQPEILRDPAPGVFFESFGDSALVFRLYYWLELNGPADARLVGSELRCRIERDLRAAGIVMPFPQRDMRLNGGEPLAVRIESPRAGDINAGPSPEP